MTTTGIGWSLRDGDWTKVRQILQQIAGLKFGYNSIPTFAGLNLSGTLNITGGLAVTADVSIGGTLTLSGQNHVGALITDTNGIVSSLASGTPSGSNVYLRATQTTGVILWQQIAYGDLSGAPSSLSFNYPLSLSVSTVSLLYDSATLDVNISNQLKVKDSIFQPLATNLTSLAGLSYSSLAFVKMSASGTFTLDTNTYLTSVTAHNILSAIHGDTLADSVVQGDIFFGNATPKWARLAKDTNATRYLSNTGTSNAPLWAQVNLANGVTGTLPIANGGTAQTSFTNNLVHYGQFSQTAGFTFDGTNTLSVNILNIPTTSSTIGQIKQNSVLFFHSYGTENLFIGATAGNTSLTAADCTGLGYNALHALTNGSNNVGIGAYAGQSITSAIGCLFIGSFAGATLQTGNANVGIGTNALYTLNGGADNFAFGTSAMRNATTAARCVAIGTETLYTGTSGISDCIAIGYGAGYYEIGPQNIYIGRDAGRGVTSQERYYSVFIGYRAGYIGAAGFSQSNICIGTYAGYNLGATSFNIFLGYQAGYRQTTGANLLIVDSPSTARADAATEVTSAIIYGTNLGGTVATQTLRFNATTKTFGRLKNIVTKTSGYTAAANDEVIYCNSTTAFAITLPPATAALVGTTYYIKNINTGNVTVTADTSGTPDLIDGNATQILNQWDCIEITCDVADNWIII